MNGKAASLPLAECFVSLQGESTHAGLRCCFIRLGGCNLRCSYCDTAWAWETDRLPLVTMESLLEKVRSFSVKLVEITGGEPLVHPEVPALCQALLDAGYEVMLETNGSMPLDAVPSAVRKIVDCKLPSSGMADQNCEANYALLQKHDEVKFVIGSREDYEFALRVIQAHQLLCKTENLLFSPVWGKISLPDLAAWMIQDQVPARFQIQLHKVIWGADAVGV